MFASPRSSARPSKFIVSALSALLAWILLMQIGVPVTASGPNGWVKGYVTDASTGMALPGAFVRVEPNALPWAYELTTDAGGYFEVSAVPQKYNVIILESSHQPFQAEVGVGSLQTTWVNASIAAAR